jgi:hypothetical protein
MEGPTVRTFDLSTNSASPVAVSDEANGTLDLSRNLAAWAPTSGSADYPVAHLSRLGVHRADRACMRRRVTDTIVTPEIDSCAPPANCEVDPFTWVLLAEAAHGDQRNEDAETLIEEAFRLYDKG